MPEQHEISIVVQLGLNQDYVAVGKPKIVWVKSEGEHVNMRSTKGQCAALIAVDHRITGFLKESAQFLVDCGLGAATTTIDQIFPDVIMYASGEYLISHRKGEMRLEVHHHTHAGES